MFGVKALKPQFTNVHGDKSDPTNYRGICVSSCLGKLFCSILNRRILLYFEENNTLHNFQIGFLPENHTADHVFTLKTLTDKYDCALSQGKSLRFSSIRTKTVLNKLNPNTASQIFDTMIFPILSYNSEVWGMYTKQDFKKMG